MPGQFWDICYSADKYFKTIISSNISSYKVWYIIISIQSTWKIIISTNIFISSGISDSHLLLVPESVRVSRGELTVLLLPTPGETEWEDAAGSGGNVCLICNFTKERITCTGIAALWQRRKRNLEPGGGLLLGCTRWCYREMCTENTGSLSALCDRQRAARGSHTRPVFV